MSVPPVAESSAARTSRTSRITLSRPFRGGMYLTIWSEKRMRPILSWLRIAVSAKSAVTSAASSIFERRTEP